MIDLSNSNFDPSIFSKIKNDGPTSDLFFKEKFVRVACFGTILIDMDKIVDPRWVADIHETIESNDRMRSGTIFSAPSSWRMPQIMKAIGAFKSAGDAKRNGWDLDVEEGLSSHIVRINHIRGAIWIYKAPFEHLNQTEF